MTETTLEVSQLSGEADLVSNAVLESVMRANLMRLGGVGLDEADRFFAAEIQETFSEPDIASAYGRVGLPVNDEALPEAIYDRRRVTTGSMRSTDAGAVSWVVPPVQCRAACYAVGTPRRYHRNVS